MRAEGTSRCPPRSSPPPAPWGQHSGAVRHAAPAAQFSPSPASAKFLACHTDTYRQHGTATLNTGGRIVQPNARIPKGLSARALLFALPVLLAAPLIAWVAYARWTTSTKGPAPLTYTVKRGLFVHDVTENGNVESANNVEIASKVKNVGSSGTVILEIVPEGTVIRPEDCIPQDAIVPLAVIEQLEEYHRQQGIKLADYGTERDPRNRLKQVAGNLPRDADPPGPAGDGGDPSTAETEPASDSQKPAGDTPSADQAMALADTAAATPVAEQAGGASPHSGDGDTSAPETPETTESNGKGAASDGQFAGRSSASQPPAIAGATVIPSTDAAVSQSLAVSSRVLAELEQMEERYPPGTQLLSFDDVKDKMVLVRLDSSSLENRLTQQQIVCENSRASVVQAEANYEAAKIALQEYLQGTYQQQYQDIQFQQTMAEENLARAQQYYAHSKLLHAKGYISDRELQANRFDVEKKRIELEMAKTKRRVLEQYTKQKRITELLADIQSAEAKLEAAKKSYQLDLEELWEIEEQIGHCTIFARNPGQVVYANQRNWRGGNEVVIEPGTYIRERQVIIRLPDPSQMQVAARINEARVNLVEPGMPVRIRLDAFLDEELRGTVQEVSDYPAPTSWFASNIKEYETKIRIENPPPGLRPGFTAQVRIRVAEEPDVLQVPVQAVFEHKGTHYCILYQNGELKAREVVLGRTNDKFVVIEEGLQEGDVVVLNAPQYRAEVGLAEEAKKHEPEGPLEDAAPRKGRGGEGASGPGRSRRGAGVAGGKKGPGGAAGRKPGDSGKQAAGQAQRAKPDPAQVFQRLDKNSDGVLETSELPSAMRPMVSAADKNGDGKIDRGEFTAAAQRLGGPRAGGRKGAPGQKQQRGGA